MNLIKKLTKYEFKLNKSLSDIDSIFADEIDRLSVSMFTKRKAQNVCTHCLIYGAQNGKRIVDDHMVKLVIQGELS